MLIFEWSEADECLEIHADDTGLARLARVIEALRGKPVADHVHLMSADWGGNELDAIKQGKENRLIHHVKMFRWPSDLSSAQSTE